MSTTPSTSPPRTPNDHRPTSKAATPNSDDSSIIDDLSFDYIFDDDGNYIRLSKGGHSSKSNQSSPPTPQDASLPDPPSDLKEDSPQPANSPLTRVSLSRSESAYSVLTGGGNPPEPKPLRSFQRVASGPALSTPSYLAPTIASSRARVMARRIPTEESHERPDPSSRSRQTLEFSSRESYTLQEEKENIIAEIEDRPSSALSKRTSPPLTRPGASRVASTRISYSSSGGSSLNSRPLADMPVQQRSSISRQPPSGLNRRIMKSSSSLKYSASERLGEVVENTEADRDAEHGPHPNPPASDTEPEDEPVEPASIPLPSSLNSGSHLSGLRHRRDLNINVQAASLSQSGGNRPRRSASLSDALHQDDYQLQVAQPSQNSHPRPGTSLGMNGEPGARRVHLGEREKQDLEARAEYKKLRRESEDRDRESPSPTHGQAHHLRLNAHRRRDSDTLRGLGPPNSATSIGSPTVMEMQGGKPSPTASRFGRNSPPSSTRGRLSPQVPKGRASPPATKGRLSPHTGSRLGTGSGREVAKHRRSPTAPEPPTTSGQMGVHGVPSSKSWANGERDEDYDPISSGEKDREKERERQMDRERERRERREQQPHQQSQQLQPYAQVPQALAHPATAAPAPPNPLQNPQGRHIVVNKKAYARLDMIGKGGSSRVYRVLNHANELYAVKRVSLDKTDAETMSGYMNEIALLKRLEGNSRIIRLIDSEVKPGPGGSKGHLFLVMECGEIDLARLLQEQMKEPVNMVWISYYWQQMLQAVHVIHEEKIVHSDLKPANFVLVKGQLKLIDFGIANAIANDTTNIQRDHQIGTVNYMSPEAIELPDGMRRLKVGRPSDVWSLGIILYQMVYGQPPFQHLSVYQKMKAIPDLSHVIEFPEYTAPCIPAKNNGVGPPEPPKRLEHLKRRVRPDVIKGMKSCLCRNPKERATIPELLEQEWLGLGTPKDTTEQERPKIHDLLSETETVINPYYMRQLLEYGMKMGQAHGGNMDPDTLLKEAERLVAELKSVHRQASENS